MHKTPNQWPMLCVLKEEVTFVSRWQSIQWLWQDIILSPDKSQLNLSLGEVHQIDESMHIPFALDIQKDLASSRYVASLCQLELFKDERTDYRFNLSSGCPKVFFALSLDQSDELPKPVHITVSQSVAACYMDTDYVVLSIDMPLPIQAWMEAYMTIHGELIEVKKKKYKGVGRAKD